IIEQIASGLRAFHRLEMVHRDLKPENIIIDNNNCAVIIDFGSTKIAGIEEIQTPYERDNLLGTLDYAASEYFRGERGNNRSDIFSLGVITYEMLCGKLPYGKALSESLLKRARYTSLKHYRPEIPAWFDSAIQKSVNLDYEKRYSILSEYIHDISQPNPEFNQRDFQPLMHRNPTLFWKILSAIELFLILVLVYQLMM
ncbi:MAG: protein kinase, partial [Gammaproteobacteria bacterium]|nr:protein kinase [Gammaproteobacteria bacterium]